MRMSLFEYLNTAQDSALLEIYDSLIYSFGHCVLYDWPFDSEV